VLKIRGDKVKREVYRRYGQRRQLDKVSIEIGDTE
jgi:hypothetical protein